MNKGTEKNIKKIKNILSDDTSKDKTNKFDVLFLIDATGSMSSYITAAKEESKNIAEELRKLYPEMMFKYGYIFYRDPIDVKTDIHEIIDLTDNVNSLPEQIGKIKATGGGDSPEDWVGAYKMANENISWRDKYPEEEAKLIQELEKCALKKIKIFGYIINDECRNSFEECSKIYRSKGGSFEIFDFISPEFNMNNPIFEMNPMMMGSKMDPMMNINSMNRMEMNPMMMGGMMNPMMNMNSMNMMGMNSMMNQMNAPMAMNMSNQSMLNMNFRNNALNSISNSLNNKKQN